MTTDSAPLPDWTISSAQSSRLGWHGWTAMAADVWSARDLAWRMMCRDLSARYRQSLLGYVWAVVPPLVVTASFLLAGQAAIFNLGDTAIPYPVFALVGTVLWQTFSEAIHAPLKAVMSAKPLLARVRFPYEAIILAKLGETLFNLAIRLVLVAVVLAIYGIPLSSTMLLAPVAIGVLILLAAGVGLLLAPLAGLYSDIEMSLTLVLSIWFFVTPVMYEQAAPGSVIAIVNAVNPVTPALVTAREAISGGTLTHLTSFAAMSAVSVALLLLAWAVYRKSLTYMIERISA